MHDLKLWRFEFYWFLDFHRWGIAAAVDCMPEFRYTELSFAIGPLQFGVLYC